MMSSKHELWGFLWAKCFQIALLKVLKLKLFSCKQGVAELSICCFFQLLSKRWWSAKTYVCWAKTDVTRNIWMVGTLQGKYYRDAFALPLSVPLSNTASNCLFSKVKTLSNSSLSQLQTWIWYSDPVSKITTFPLVFVLPDSGLDLQMSMNIHSQQDGLLVGGRSPAELKVGSTGYSMTFPLNMKYDF